MKYIKSAAAVLAAGAMITGASHANETATLYGSIEIGLGYDTARLKKQSASRLGLHSGVGRFGLMGSHSLDAETSVRYVLESGFVPASGAGSPTRLFSREATLGVVNTRLGAIDVGRHYNFSALYTGAVDPFGGGYGLSGLDSTVGSGLRLDNLVLYQSPNFAGFEGGVGYSFNVDDVTWSNENKRLAQGDPADSTRHFFGASKHTRLFTTGLQYAKGPFNAMVAYDKVWRRNDAPGKSLGTTIEAWVLGAAYEVEPVTLYGTVHHTVDGWMSAKNMAYMPGKDTGFKDYHYAKGFAATTGMLGVRMDRGPHRYMASWQHARARNKRLTGHDRPFNMYSLGYRYSLSKRTELTAFVSYGSNYAFVGALDGVQSSMRIRHRF